MTNWHAAAVVASYAFTGGLGNDISPVIQDQANSIAPAVKHVTSNDVLSGQSHDEVAGNLVLQSKVPNLSSAPEGYYTSSVLRSPVNGRGPIGRG